MRDETGLLFSCLMALPLMGSLWDHFVPMEETGRGRRRSRRKRKRKGSRRGREEPLGTWGRGGRARSLFFSFPRRVLDHWSRPVCFFLQVLESRVSGILPGKEGGREGPTQSLVLGVLFHRCVSFRRCFCLDRFLRLSALVPLRAKFFLFWFFSLVFFLSFFFPWVTFVNSVVTIVDHFTWILGSSRATGSGHDALPR